LLPEPEKFGSYAGQGETKPKAVTGFIKSEQTSSIEFQVPAPSGVNYRLFVYVYDGHGNVGVANIPFYVRDQ